VNQLTTRRGLNNDNQLIDLGLFLHNENTAFAISHQACILDIISLLEGDASFII